MFSDITIPKNNEEEFIQIATKLGIKKLCFLYDFDDFNEEKIQKKLDSIENKKIILQFGLIVNQKNISKAAQQSRLLIVKSSDKDRLFVESGKIKLVYGFEEAQRKDYLHQRASGLNHTICELAKKNNVAVGFSYSLLFNKNSQISSLLIGRMMQNISLCQKYKVKTIIASFSEKPFGMKSHHDIASLFVMLGMKGERIKESMYLSF